MVASVLGKESVYVCVCVCVCDILMDQGVEKG